MFILNPGSRGQKGTGFRIRKQWNLKYCRQHESENLPAGRDSVGLVLELLWPQLVEWLYIVIIIIIRKLHHHHHHHHQPVASYRNTIIISKLHHHH
jgi:hypothetical protein